MRAVLLAGGTGAAKLAPGLLDVLGPDQVSIVTNTGDDEEFWGLPVCPDTDSVLYRIAGIFNDETGYGIAGETHAALAMLQRLGEETWFTLGDRDIAVHLLRRHLLSGGSRLTEAVAEIARRLGVTCAVLPMCDEPVRTRIVGDGGEYGLQEWFVRHRAEPRVRGVRLAGIESARPTPEVLAALDAAEVVIIGPSNPLISIGPILEVLGGRLRGRRVIAVSPIVGGRSLKGPTVRMLADLGRPATALEPARDWSDVATDYVLDREDAGLTAEVEALGLRTHVAGTVMEDRDGAARLARELVAIAGG